MSYCLSAIFNSLVAGSAFFHDFTAAYSINNKFAAFNIPVYRTFIPWDAAYGNISTDYIAII
ncbi:hypothetical protein [Endozoicomonas atrinae]|uniref:hypothetical protein n=1 Tax=Endozoicomonas atrinae TaxID=1333660 RepID=UPI00082428B0|nr:hypothetical protein [Endozoicomonas atrinae]